MRSFAVKTLLCLALSCPAAAAHAASIGLDALVGGATLDSDDGTLTFSDFQVVLTMNLTSDLSQYTVTSRDDGFRIAGPFDAPVGVDEGAQMTLLYSVAAHGGATLEQASGQIQASGGGPGSSAVLLEQFFDDGSLLATMQDDVDPLPGSAGILFDLSGLGLGALDVRKEIFVEADDLEASGSVDFVDQGFQVSVPEPGSAGLLALGLGGLAVAGRRRR